MVVQIEMNNQNKAVKSLALNLFSTTFPNSSIAGQPQPNQSTMNCSFAQQYGTSKTTNSKSGARRTAVFFINLIHSHASVKFKFMQPLSFATLRCSPMNRPSSAYAYKGDSECNSQYERNEFIHVCQALGSSGENAHVQQHEKNKQC